MPTCRRSCSHSTPGQGVRDGLPSSRLYWGGAYAEHSMTLLHAGDQAPLLLGSREIAPGIHCLFGQEQVAAAACDVSQVGVRGHPEGQQATWQLWCGALDIRTWRPPWTAWRRMSGPLPGLLLPTGDPAGVAQTAPCWGPPTWPCRAAPRCASLRAPAPGAQGSWSSKWSRAPGPAQPPAAAWCSSPASSCRCRCGASWRACWEMSGQRGARSVRRRRRQARRPRRRGGRQRQQAICEPMGGCRSRLCTEKYEKNAAARA